MEEPVYRRFRALAILRLKFLFLCSLCFLWPPCPRNLTSSLVNKPSRPKHRSLRDNLPLYCSPDVPPVDTTPSRAHGPSVCKKPSKIEEPKAAYAAQKPAKAVPAAKTEVGGVRTIDDATFKKASDKVFKTHSELFRKLAQ